MKKWANKQYWLIVYGLMITWDVWKFRWRIFKMYWAGASRYQIFLEKGAYYLKKGAVYQVGQPFKQKDKRTGKVSQMYIQNLFYNFRENKVTPSLSVKKQPNTEDFEKFDERLSNE